MEKECKQCGTVKPLEEFHKQRSRPDGLQRYCKVCCNLNSKKFRERRPDYYWGEKDGYFVKNYDTTMKYQLDRSRADKSTKIYLIETPDGVYIGSTKRLIKVRMVTHMCDYMCFHRGKKRAYLPLLHHSFEKYPKEEVRGFLNDVKVLEEFESDIVEARRKESFWIEYYRRMGFNLLNVNDPFGPVMKKKYAEILK